jgi:Ca-activated chloride channel family protein
MRSFITILLLGIWFSCFGHFLAAQSRENQTNWQDARGSEKQPVTLRVNVWDQENNAVTGLRQQSFEVYENGVRQTISSFTAGDEPLTLGILLDASTSQKKHIAASIKAIKTFIAAGNPDDEFFLATFGKEVALKADFTFGESLLNQLVTPELDTNSAVYDAVAFGLQKAARGRYAKRALLLITDGQESGSQVSYKKLMKLVKDSDVQIYCLGVGNTNSNGGVVPGDYWLGHLLLEEMSDITGGATYLKDKPEQVKRGSEIFATRLRHQYKISYFPANLPSNEKWRRIKVRMSSPVGTKELKCNTRQGYYSMP